MLIKRNLDTFTVNTNNLAIYETISELLSVNKSTGKGQQKRKFALKQQAPSIQHQREHLSIQLLESIQLLTQLNSIQLLFVLLINLILCTIFTNKARYLYLCINQPQFVFLRRIKS